MGTNRDRVIIYTDGSCIGNPGVGGWACILLSGKHTLRLSCYAHNGAFIPQYTSNDRMEIQAVIEGLKKLKIPCDVEVRTDSANIVNAFNEGTIDNWRKDGWKNGPKNVDVWWELYKLTQKHNVTFTKVPAHSGDRYNEECDKMCRAEARSVKDMFMTNCPDCGAEFNPSTNLKVKKPSGRWVFRCPECNRDYVRQELDFIYNIKEE
jgi:ribonuclease HI